MAYIHAYENVVYMVVYMTVYIQVKAKAKGYIHRVNTGVYMVYILVYI